MDEIKEVMDSMENVEVVDLVPKTPKLGKGGVIVAGIALGTLVGGAIYKYVAKPVVAKIKAKIQEQKESGGKEDEETVIHAIDK